MHLWRNANVVQNMVNVVQNMVVVLLGRAGVVLFRLRRKGKERKGIAIDLFLFGFDILVRFVLFGAHSEGLDGREKVLSS